MIDQMIITIDEIMVDHVERRRTVFRIVFKDFLEEISTIFAHIISWKLDWFYYEWRIIHYCIENKLPPAINFLYASSAVIIPQGGLPVNISSTIHPTLHKSVYTSIVFVTNTWKNFFKEKFRDFKGNLRSGPIDGVSGDIGDLRLIWGFFFKYRLNTNNSINIREFYYTIWIDQHIRALQIPIQIDEYLI